MRHSRIILYIPDLAAGIRAARISHLRVLDKLRARARSSALTSGAQILGEHFGLHAREFPTAAIERLGITGVREDGFWWRADPVNLLVDRDQVAMLPRRVLGVTAEEAQTLAAKFNATYAADGYVIETPTPHAWYLRVPSLWHCRTWDPAEVEGWAITDFMPAGAYEDALKKLMNEIQMLFFEHAVNQAREQAGKLTINSLWLWGGGALPEKTGHTPSRVIGNLPLVRGLAQLGGSISEPWTAKSQLRAGAGDTLIGATLADFGCDPLRMDAELLRPCWEALLRGHASTLECFLGGRHAYMLTRAAAMKFWRRPQTPLAQLDDASAATQD